MNGAVRIAILAASAPLAGYLLGVSIFLVWGYLELAFTPLALPLSDAAIRTVGLAGALWIGLFLLLRRPIRPAAQALLIGLFTTVTAFFAGISLVSHQSY